MSLKSKMRELLNAEISKLTKDIADMTEHTKFADYPLDLSSNESKLCLLRIHFAEFVKSCLELIGITRAYDFQGFVFNGAIDRVTFKIAEGDPLPNLDRLVFILKFRNCNVISNGVYESGIYRKINDELQLFF